MPESLVGAARQEEHGDIAGKHLPLRLDFSTTVRGEHQGSSQREAFDHGSLSEYGDATHVFPMRMIATISP